MKQIFIFGFGLIILFGCNSNNDIQTDFAKIFGNTEQTFVINNRNDTVLIGLKGTQIFLPKNLLSRSLSKNDAMKVVLREFYTTSDMILAGLSTTSNGKIIETNGMIDLNIYINNQKVEKIDKLISISFAKDTESYGYSIFYGDFKENKINWELDTLTKNYHICYNMVLNGKPCNPIYRCDYAMDTVRIDSIHWQNSYTKIDSIITFSESNDTISFAKFWRSDSTISQPLYEFGFRVSKLGWINCDRFIDFPDLTGVKVKSNSSSNPYYFLVFNDLNSIMPNYEKNEFSNVPIGQIVTLIGIETRENKLYYGISDKFMIKKDIVVDLKLKESSAEYIKQLIRKIDK